MSGLQTQIDHLDAQNRKQVEIIKSYEAQIAKHDENRRSWLELLNTERFTFDRIIRQRNSEAEMANTKIAELEAALAVFRGGTPTNEGEDQ